MVKDLKGVSEAISKWIAEKQKDASASSLVLGISGGVDSAVVAFLCRNAGSTIGVAMPCQSSPASMGRAQELADAADIELLTVKLDTAYESIKSQARSTLWNIIPGNAENGALRSCLRAPTLDYVAKLTNGIIVGTGNRDEDEMTRYFQKRGDGAVDISPIAKLHKSEVYQLARYLGVPQSIIDAKPSADLWGPDAGQEDEKEIGMTYEEVEWGIREFSPLLECAFLPNVAIPLPVGSYSPRQLEVLKKLQKMELASRHKAKMPPVFDVRRLTTLVE